MDNGLIGLFIGFAGAMLFTGFVVVPTVEHTQQEKFCLSKPHTQWIDNQCRTASKVVKVP